MPETQDHPSGFQYDLNEHVHWHTLLFPWEKEMHPYLEIKQL